MKKILFAVILVVSSVSAFAQKPISWEGQFGMNVAKFTNYESKIGFNLGVRAKMELPSFSDGVYANAGAFLTQKGTSLDMGELGDIKVKANYLEIPIHVGYQYAIDENFSVFGEFGPYFAIGLWGKAKGRELDFDDNWNEVFTEFSYNTFDEFKRFDFGLGFRFGVEFKQKYIVGIGYDFGLINAWKSPDLNDDEIDLTGSLKSRNLTISVGYKF